MSDWRIAAAVTVLIAGGSSLVVMKQAPNGGDTRPLTTDTVVNRAMAATAPTVDRSGQSPSGPAVAAPAQRVEKVASATTTDASTDEGVDSRFGGLSDAQMQALLSEIDGLKAVPVTEPEPVTIRVDPKPGSPEGLR